MPNLFQEMKKCIYTFITHQSEGNGSRNPTLWETKIRISFMDKNMVVDGLAT